MRERIQRFMMGRYGMDALGKFLTGLTFVVIVLSFFVNNYVVNVFVLALIGYSYFRMFSRNISKRYAENQKFLQITWKFRSQIERMKKDWNQRKIYRFYSCPKCGKRVRVPRGRGKICITCPSCRHEFIKKS